MNGAVMTAFLIMVEHRFAIGFGRKKGGNLRMPGQFMPAASRRSAKARIAAVMEYVIALS